MKTLKQFLGEGNADDPKHQKELEKFRRRALKAFRKHGHVRSQEWRDAVAEKDAYVAKHKLYIHNPD